MCDTCTGCSSNLYRTPSWQLSVTSEEENCQILPTYCRRVVLANLLHPPHTVFPLTLYKFGISVKPCFFLSTFHLYSDCFALIFFQFCPLLLFHSSHLSVVFKFVFHVCISCLLISLPLHSYTLFLLPTW